MNSTKKSALQQDLTTPQYWDRQWTTTEIVDRQEPVEKRKRKRARTQPFLSLMAQALDQRFGNVAKVLEVGCAPGYLLSEFAGLRPNDRLSGVDFTTEGLDFSRQLFREQQIQATLHQADVRDFSPESLYDLVYSCGLIEHFTEPESILSHHVRLCKPGGIVAVSIPNYSSQVQKWFMRQLDPESLVTHNLSMMNTEALQRLMVDVGLQKVRAGGVGTATLRSRVEGTGPTKIFLRRVAQAWNLTNQLLPQISGWHSTLWAMGQVPE